ncbi:MAG: hypothetical protein GYB53_18915 [Rhodobacteraceae bacterium]|nr:hypothetical protein [Paracoccaceae bacterium]
MDITFTEDQERYRAGIRTWLAQNLPANWTEADHWPQVDEDAEQAFLIDWERRLYAAGYSGIAWPKAYGGQGLGPVEDYIVNEEIGLAEAPESLNTIGRELVAPILLSVGTEEQKLRYIPKILQMDDIWCQGFSEPNAGSDLAAIKTRAERRGDVWVANGQKIWTSYAHMANHCILLAKTDTGARAHRGMTLFIVPMDTPGIEVRGIRHLGGQRHFNEVFFTDVEIRDEMRIGEVNAGWQVAVGVLGFERATTRLYRQGRFMQELRSLHHEAQRSGKLTASLEERMGAVAAELQLLKYQNLKFLGRIMSGSQIGDESSLLKLSWSQIHQKIAHLGLEVLGADLDEDSAFAGRFRKIYLTARGETIYAGSSQIQRNIIAERVLGLPRPERKPA